ncbi:SRPBCC domain-containing protein [Methanoregula sp.]|uniref:SRPBCC family protein n=1 Tax=Methanoregula sp. TaxID=2052170 RepID=UPI00262D4F5E|nr:SRPBCC domain-containing protein [Methanoregula sp.]MDD5144486.1 SRPBCC domain-containing protein [Methanoregula sp.]
MEQITRSKKYQNGIQVFWTEEGNEKNDFFSYDALVEQRINALDLLNNPRLYLMNAPGHRIEFAAPGCSFPSKTCEDEILITRFFDAPREFVWRAWTEPELVRMWWGPKDYTCPSCTIDLRIGGSYLYCMRSPEGRDIWSTGVFREIVLSERLVCTDNFADEKGNVVPATSNGMSPDIPLEMIVTVTFEDQSGRTRLTLRHAGLPAGEMNDLTRAGWNESLDKLAGIVARNVFRGKRTVRVVGNGEKA